jgi:hypothetical protein
MHLRRLWFSVGVLAILTCPTVDYSQVEQPNDDGGRRLVKRVVEFFGGEQNLSTVKSVQERLSERYYAGDTGHIVMSGDSVRIIEFPASVQFTLINGGVSKTLGPSGAFGVNHGKVFDLSSGRSGMLDDVKRDIINIAQHVDDNKYQFKLVGKGKLGTKEATIVEIDADGAKTQWGIDAESGKLLVVSEDFNDNLFGASSVQQIVYFSGYKKFGGLNLPAKSVVAEHFSHEFSDALDRQLGHLGGNVGTIFHGTADLTIEKINPTIPKDAFTLPTR